MAQNEVKKPPLHVLYFVCGHSLIMTSWLWFIFELWLFVSYRNTYSMNVWDLRMWIENNHRDKIIITVISNHLTNFLLFKLVNFCVNSDYRWTKGTILLYRSLKFTSKWLSWLKYHNPNLIENLFCHDRRALSSTWCII